MSLTTISTSNIRNRTHIKKYALAVAVIITILIVASILIILQDTRQYFFFQDPDFSVSDNSESAKWKSFGWHFSDPFDYKISFGNDSATLFYNESSGMNWAGAVLLQGRQPHSTESGPKILGGASINDAKEADYVEFSNSSLIENGKFFLEARVMVTARNYTVFDTNGEAISNVGADLMFGFDEANYDEPNMTKQVAIHAGVLFSRAWWDNETRTIHHNSNWSNLTSDLYAGDFQITLIRGQIPELNTFYTFKIDLTEIIKNIFDLTQKEVLRFYGVQVYVDGIGSYTEATFDYVKTSVNS